MEVVNYYQEEKVMFAIVKLNHTGTVLWSNSSKTGVNPLRLVPKWNSPAPLPVCDSLFPTATIVRLLGSVGSASFYPCAVGWHRSTFMLGAVPVVFPVVVATPAACVLEKEIARGEI